MTASIADLGRAIARAETLALSIKAERDRYEAALRKIAGWKGYAPTSNDVPQPVSEYESGANDMLATLKQMAMDALYPEPACNGGVDLEA
jgi:hypothetical protein